jgi:hypothetical protein
MVNLSRIFKVWQEQQEVNKIRAVFFRKKSSAKGKLVEETISNFLEDFNLTNWSKVTFKNFFDIYNDKSTKSTEENIAICKAFLDFIQTHWMEISFEWKTYVLKYSIIWEINYIFQK